MWNVIDGVSVPKWMISLLFPSSPTSINIPLLKFSPIMVCALLCSGSKSSPACSWKGNIAACLRDSFKGSRHCAARGSRRLAEKETRRGLSLLAIDRLPLIFLASCYLDWNIIPEIPLLEYPTQLTRLLEQRLQHVTMSSSQHTTQMTSAAGGRRVASLR